MADFSWNDVLRNRTQYPDEMVVDLNGQAIALGDLRNVTIPKEDMTRLTQGWSQREAAAQQRIATLEEQLASSLRAQEAYATQQAPSSPPSPLAQPDGAPILDYDRDPILGPIFRATSQTLERQNRTDQVIEKLEKTLQGLGTQLGQWPVMFALDNIKRNDPYGVDPQQLVQHALTMRQGPPNLNDAYTLLTREQREAQIRQEAEQAAYAKAKQELARGQVPYQPFGQPQTLRTPDPTYATLDEAEQAAIMDPEMLAILMGQAA